MTGPGSRHELGRPEPSIVLPRVDHRLRCRGAGSDPLILERRVGYRDLRSLRTATRSVGESGSTLVGNVTLRGTVSTMFFRTRYAAVATAASSDAVLPNRLFRRYGR